LCRGSQFKDQCPHLTGARFIASSTAIFDLDFHDVVLTTEPTGARRFRRMIIPFDTSYPGLKRCNFVIRPDVGLNARSGPLWSASRLGRGRRSTSDLGPLADVLLYNLRSTALVDLIKRARHDCVPCRWMSLRVNEG
jgi:hypothetical protein